MQNKSQTLHRNRSPVSLWEWAVACGILGFMLLLYTYIDLQSLTIWSTNLLDVIYEGRFTDFYAYCAMNLHGAPHAYIGGDLIGILPWAVWNVPIWIYQRFFEGDLLHSPWAMLWSKTFLVFVFSLIQFLTYRIALLVTGERKKAVLATFLCASSLFLFSSIGYAGQNDVLVILPSLGGIYALLKGNRPGFYLLSALAISVKPFILFPYLAVILLLEKNFLRCVGKLFCGVSFLLFFRIASRGMPMYAQSLENGASDKVLINLFQISIPSPSGNLSLFLIGLAVLYIWCYLTSPSGKKEFAQVILYAVTAAYLLLMLCTVFEFYRPVLLLPFLYLVMISNSKALFPSVLLDTVMQPCMMLMVFLRRSMAFRPMAMEQSVFSLPYVDPALRRYPIPGDFVHFTPVYAVVMAVCAVLLLLLNYPGNRFQLHKRYEACPHWLLGLRLFAPLIFIALSFLCYFALK